MRTRWMRLAWFSIVLVLLPALWVRPAPGVAGVHAEDTRVLESSPGMVSGSSKGNDIATENGRAAVRRKSAPSEIRTPAWTMGDDQTDAQFARAVDTAEDVNGDGYADLVAGVLYFSDWGKFDGWAYVYHGGTPASQVPFYLPLVCLDPPVNRAPGTRGCFHEIVIRSSVRS